ncbi:MAG: hypothetical protein M3404_06610 [Actinomycetota bacterium]|nr:hypothetical protein [Actinomycetota bacterium]
MGAVLEWVESVPKALRFAESHAAVLGVAVTTVVVAAVLAVTWATRRALDARVRIAAVPTESFDPSEEEVIRFAGLLARTRPSVRGVASRRASAVRIRLVALDGGRILQLLEGPGRSLSVLRLGGYDEVDLRPPESLDGGVVAGGGRGERRDRSQEGVGEDEGEGELARMGGEGVA